MIKVKSISSDHLPLRKINTTLKHSPNTSPGSTSPLKSHKEIELFHNLTRSPVRERRPSTVDIINVDNTNKKTENGGNTFNSFKLYSSPISKEDPVTNGTDIIESGFKVLPLTEENKILALPPPDDVRNSTVLNNNLTSSESSTFSTSDKICKNNDVHRYTDLQNGSDNQTKALEYIPCDTKSEFDSFKVCSSDTSYAISESTQDENLTDGLKKNDLYDLDKKWQISSLSSDVSSAIFSMHLPQTISNIHI